MSRQISPKVVLRNIRNKHTSDNTLNKTQKSNWNLKKLKIIFNQEAIIFYAQSRMKVFTVDSDNKLYLNLLCKYFSRDMTFETEHGGHLNKGLFIYGNKGSGKTTSLKIIQSLYFKYQQRQFWFPRIDCQEVVDKFNMARNKDYIVKNYSKGSFMFDDLGAENLANNIHVFGKEDIFIRIMEARYNEFVNKGVRTHITSNLTPQDVGKRYGSRVEDRFYEMFNLIELNVSGESRR
ncbi:hypothetical protein [Aurantibacter sp.]|uniref:hypothetical protein n=1 Tax=Aurantibacter sp. TaxID=2807103 RepID=UPI003264F0C1